MTLYLPSQIKGNIGKELCRATVADFFCQPHELKNRNVRGVDNKEAMNQDKIAKIKELVFRYVPTSLSQQENLWQNCHKTVDSYYFILHNRKEDS